MRALATLLLSLPLCGCFVFEELEAGEKIMEQNSKRKVEADKERAAAAQAEAEDRGPVGAAWWSEARSLNGPARRDTGDPNAPVSCRIGGHSRFMRRAECLAQGGSAS